MIRCSLEGFVALFAGPVALIAGGIVWAISGDKMTGLWAFGFFAMWMVAPLMWRLVAGRHV